jgi:DNA-binding MurR/RpiR family transcriptional regulator
MSGQGRFFSDETLRRIIHLLASTDMTIKEIAERMVCSRSAVVSINRKFQIRSYAGLRSRWRTEGNTSRETREKPGSDGARPQGEIVGKKSA